MNEGLLTYSIVQHNWFVSLRQGIFLASASPVETHLAPDNKQTFGFVSSNLNQDTEVDLAPRPTLQVFMKFL